MLEIRLLSPETWNDFVALMESDAQCSECWCLNHRAAPGCATGGAAKEQMQRLVSEQRAHGLLAFHGSECVGWISVDPMRELVGHDRLDTAKEREWSIHCLFAKEGFRGRGLSTLMIRAAIDYAKANGAQLISAFPIPTENRGNFPPNEAEFSGRLTTFAKLGFRPAGEASDFYQRMELKD